jgi:hypothetical protein
MTAYDIAAWSEFASTVADVAAALAGLRFVGLSMNLREVLAYPALPARAAATLGLLIAILLTGIFLVTPGPGPPGLRRGSRCRRTGHGHRGRRSR